MASTAHIPLGPVMTIVSGETLNSADRKRILSPVVGGVVLFANNCKSVNQIKELIKEIHSLREPKLVIAIDQEGGRVQRIKDGVTCLPPQAKYGELFDKNEDLGCDAAELGGYLMAREMLELGIDISFSPVLDVSTVDSKVIGDRAFHSNPHTVATLGESWIRGMSKAGMKAVGKHFPGHGGVKVDSHETLPEDNRDIREILECDLIPYRKIGSRLAAVMTAHVWFPSATTAIPTYSLFWLEHILREVLVFHGIVISDDLTMAGAEDAGDMDARIMTALACGCDIALVCQDEDLADEAINILAQIPDSWKPPYEVYEKLKPEPEEELPDINKYREQFLTMVSES